MRTLTIEATSLESAHRLQTALTAFAATVGEGEDGSYRVTVALEGSERILAVLRAIEEQVRSRDDGPALIDLDGKSYTLEGGCSPETISPGGNAGGRWPLWADLR